jgi:hypothetical protein
MKTLMKCVCAAIAAVTLATSAPADNPNSKPNTETARTGDLVLDNSLILLDSEIPKPHKDPNFDQIAAFSEISPAVASVHMRSRSHSRGSVSSSSGPAWLGSKPRGIVRQTALSRGQRHARCRN